MILREMFYFEKENSTFQQDDRYYASRDTDIMDITDNRKVRLTLKQINELRRASDQHIKEQQTELEFITRMYSTPAPEA